jgi:hypothetical protein
VHIRLAVAALAPVIVPERADSRDGRVLIAELEQELDPHYPEASRHGYSVEKLLREAVAFFGFRRTAPFGTYRDDPLSAFYEMRIG